jgi:DNA-binding MarR family transcriptional regulator
LYRPGIKVYPYPEYIGGLPYIECDYEIANFHLNNLKNGFVGSTIVNFFNGTPKPENQRAIESKLKKKFTGTDNAGKFILIFNDSKDKEPTVLNLTPSDMDKQFDLLNKTVQQEIFSAHKITSPMFFGIKTEGQLGGRTEIIEAWELFQNTYIKYKQNLIEDVFNDLFENKGLGRPIKLTKTTPIGLSITDAQLERVMTDDEVREIAGLSKLKIQTNKTNDAINTLSPLVANKVLESMTEDEIRGLVALPPKQKEVSGDVIPDAALEATTDITTNENIKNLTGRQLQNVQRIVRKYDKGELTREQAAMLLKSGYGLSDAEVDLFLVVSDDVQEFSDDVNKVLEVFATFGTPKSEYQYITSQRVKLGTIVRDGFNFADELNAKQKKIIQIIKQDPLVDESDIADAMKIDVEQVRDLIADMERNELIVRETSNDVSKLKVTDKGNRVMDSKVVNEIVAMYDYRKRANVSGPTIIPTSREFCRKLIELDRYYTRKDIQQMSQRLGRDVFEYCGGFWTQKSGETKPYCRHDWYLNILRKK